MISTTKSIKYLRYRDFEDLFKIILAHSQSALGLIPLVYHVKLNDIEILFIQNGPLGNGTVHFIICKEEVRGRFIDLHKMTGEYKFVDAIGSDTKSIYVPVLELEKTTLQFPIQ